MLFLVSLQVWGQAKLAVQDWFASPQRVLVPLLAIACITFAFGTRSWRPLVLRTTLGIVISYLILISPIGAALAVEGLNQFLPVDDGRPVDAVVILGRGTFLEAERSQAAAQFWRQQRSPLVLATGHGGEATRLVQRLLAEGVPPSALIEEPCARTTEENALFSAPLLRQKKVQRILLITDSPHMLRSLLTFQSVGFDVVPYPLSLPHNLPSIHTSVSALREYAGLASYALAGRFQPRSGQTAKLSFSSQSLTTTCPTDSLRADAVNRPN